jgi:predicted glycosyl hydrolase (DUF1957 family)
MVVFFAYLWHIYQPPVQIAPVLKQITNESYRPLIQCLRDHPDAHVSLNINATLTEQLNDFGFTDVIEGLTTLAARNQIDFTGSAKFHPLLPLLPEPEIIRQIELNTQTNRKFFGNVYNPKGFFPPEMAVSEEIYAPVKKAGFEWIIMSGIANTLAEFPTTHISFDKNSGLKLIFRDDIISIDNAFDKINNVDAFSNRLKYKWQDHDYYVILAMDGETFGHHIKHAIKNFLNPLFDALPHRSDIKMVNISEIVKKFPSNQKQTPRASSWSTMSYDIERGVPFPLWLEPNNELHQQQHHIIMYSLTAINLAQKYRDSMNDAQKGMFDNARNFLDRGIHSCQQWWASKRPWYSPDMILRGLNEILMAVVNARRSIPENALDIRDALQLILDEILKAHNKIVISLA